MSRRVRRTLVAAAVAALALVGLAACVGVSLPPVPSVTPSSGLAPGGQFNGDPVESVNGTPLVTVSGPAAETCWASATGEAPTTRASCFQGSYALGQGQVGGREGSGEMYLLPYDCTDGLQVGPGGSNALAGRDVYIGFFDPGVSSATAPLTWTVRLGYDC
jgi:hypothetical protein